MNFESLPEEIVDLILSKLDPINLLTAELVCVQWHNLAKTSERWKLASIAKWGEEECYVSTYPQGWRQMYLDDNRCRQLRTINWNIVGFKQLKPNLKVDSPTVMCCGSVWGLTSYHTSSESFSVYLNAYGPKIEITPTSASQQTESNKKQKLDEDAVRRNNNAEKKPWERFVAFTLSVESTDSSVFARRLSFQKFFKEGEDTTWGWVNALNSEEIQEGSYIDADGSLTMNALVAVFEGERDSKTLLKVFISGVLYGKGEVKRLCLDLVNKSLNSAVRDCTELRKLFRERRGVDKLVEILQSDDVDIRTKTSAAGLCQTLAFNDYTSEKFIIDAGGIPALLHALQIPHAALQKRSSGSILNLQQCNETSESVVAAGGIQLGISLIKQHEKNPDLLQEVAGLIANAAVTEASGAKLITSLGALPLLFNCLQFSKEPQPRGGEAEENNLFEQDTTILELNSAIALKYAIRNSLPIPVEKDDSKADINSMDTSTSPVISQQPYRQRRKCEGYYIMKQFFPVLFDVWKKGEEKITSTTCSAGIILGSLAVHSKKCRQAIRNERILAHTLAWLKEEVDAKNSGISESVLNLLLSIFEVDFECRRFFLTTVAQTPVAVLDGENQNTNNNKGSPPIGQGGIELLIALIGDEDSSHNVKWFAARCLFAISSFYPPASVKIREDEGLPVLLSLLTVHKEALARTETCWALVNVAHNDKESRSKLLELNILAHVEEILTTTAKSEIRMAAIALVSILMSHKKHHPTALNHDEAINEVRSLRNLVFPHVVWLLAYLRKTSNIEVKIYGTETIGLLVEHLPKCCKAGTNYTTLLATETLPVLDTFLSFVLETTNPLLQRTASHAIWAITTAAWKTERLAMTTEPTTAIADSMILDDVPAACSVAEWCHKNQCHRLPVLIEDPVACHYLTQLGSCCQQQ